MSSGEKELGPTSKLLGLGGVEGDSEEEVVFSRTPKAEAPTLHPMESFLRSFLEGTLWVSVRPARAVSLNILEGLEPLRGAPPSVQVLIKGRAFFLSSPQIIGQCQCPEQ